MEQLLHSQLEMHCRNNKKLMYQFNLYNRKLLFILFPLQNMKIILLFYLCSLFYFFLLHHHYPNNFSNEDVVFKFLYKGVSAGMLITAGVVFLI